MHLPRPAVTFVIAALALIVSPVSATAVAPAPSRTQARIHAAVVQLSKHQHGPPVAQDNTSLLLLPCPPVDYCTSEVVAAAPAAERITRMLLGA